MIDFFELFGLKEFAHTRDLIRLILRLVLDLSCAWVIIRGVHLRLYRNRDLAFTYMMLNVITFSLCFLLRKVPVDLGFALGLFAVFGVLRYRTEPIRTRDLTYLFIVIGLAILNAVANKYISFAELVGMNLVIVALTWLMAMAPMSKREETHNVIYDNLALLEPGRRHQLLADLSERTGLRVTSVHVGDIDLLKDTVRLSISCEPKPQEDEPKQGGVVENLVSSKTKTSGT